MESSFRPNRIYLMRNTPTKSRYSSFNIFLLVQPTSSSLFLRLQSPKLFPKQKSKSYEGPWTWRHLCQMSPARLTVLVLYLVTIFNSGFRLCHFSWIMSPGRPPKLSWFPNLANLGYSLKTTALYTCSRQYPNCLIGYSSRRVPWRVHMPWAFWY